jgi:hypothetical protein
MVWCGTHHRPLQASSRLARTTTLLSLMTSDPESYKHKLYIVIEDGCHLRKTPHRLVQHTQSPIRTRQRSKKGRHSHPKRPPPSTPRALSHPPRRRRHHHRQLHLPVLRAPSSACRCSSPRAPRRPRSRTTACARSSSRRCSSLSSAAAASTRTWRLCRPTSRASTRASAALRHLAFAGECV